MQNALIAVGWTVGPLSYSAIDGSAAFTVFAGTAGAVRGSRAVKPHTRTFTADGTMTVTHI